MTYIFQQQKMVKKQEECSIHQPQERYQPPLFEVSLREHNFHQYCCQLRKCWALHTKAIYCSFKTQCLNQWHSPPKTLQQNISSIDVILSSPIMVYMVGGIVSTVTMVPPLE